MFDLKAHLKTLSESHAISGHETHLHALVEAAWQGLVDDFDYDGLGSVIGIKRATRPNPHRHSVMLAAHMDEIGLMVRDIVDGFILVQGVAGVDARTLLGKPVFVHGTQRLPGYIGAVPPHMLNASQREKYPSVHELVVDVGMSDEEVRALVRIGDMVTPDAPVWELNSNLLVGKAFDDRACLAAITSCLHALQGYHHAWDVYAVATVQEENGLYGAQTAAQHLNPTVAVALDVTFAAQAGVPVDSSSELGGGVVIAAGANFHPLLLERMLETAKRHEIKHQLEALPSNSGTDAWAIQVAREGIPTLLLSVPLRNMHSAVETLDVRDVARAAQLLAHFVAELDDSVLPSIAFPLPTRET